MSLTEWGGTDEKKSKQLLLWGEESSQASLASVNSTVYVAEESQKNNQGLETFFLFWTWTQMIVNSQGSQPEAVVTAYKIEDILYT